MFIISQPNKLFRFSVVYPVQLRALSKYEGLRKTRLVTLVSMSSVVRSCP